jgi:DNA-binding GntR family transcriptional regulator
VTQFEVPMTRSGAVAQRLRDEITGGDLPPGRILKDAELAARLGVSITPVREAIAQLAAEGLVDVSPNRTRKVAQLSQKSALELVDVMELLACAGFERGVDNLTEEHLALLRRRYEEYADALDRSDGLVAGSAGADFSTIIVMAGGNRELQSLLDLVVLRSVRMMSVTAHPEVWEPWRRGYAEVLERLEAHDHPAALARYRQIYVDYRHAVEHVLWPDATAT